MGYGAGAAAGGGFAGQAGPAIAGAGGSSGLMGGLANLLKDPNTLSSIGGMLGGSPPGAQQSQAPSIMPPTQIDPQLIQMALELMKAGRLNASGGAPSEPPGQGAPGRLQSPGMPMPGMMRGY